MLSPQWFVSHHWQTGQVEGLLNLSGFQDPSTAFVM